jgi:hypothetical protein
MKADAGHRQFLRLARQIERIQEGPDLENPIRPQAGRVAARSEPLQPLVSDAPDQAAV